jgi:hypothetical protein
VTVPEPLDDDTDVDGVWRVVGVVVLALVPSVPVPVDVVVEVPFLDVVEPEVLWVAFFVECPE